MNQIYIEAWSKTMLESHKIWLLLFRLKAAITSTISSNLFGYDALIVNPIRAIKTVILGCCEGRSPHNHYLGFAPYFGNYSYCIGAKRTSK